MLLIYNPHNTNRFKYSLHLLFESACKLPYTVTTHLTDFETYTGPKLYVGKPENKNTNYPYIYNSGLLTETILRPERPNPGQLYLGLPTFFDTNDTGSFLPFDIFAAAFYIASRYKEYLPHPTDIHGRFIPSQSLGYTHNFLHKPIVNIWALHLAEKLQQIYPQLTYTKPTYSYVSTIDIDHPFASAHKGFVRWLGGALKALGTGDISSINKRISALIDDKTDPYYTYPLIFSLAEELGIKPRFFFLLGDYGEYDKNPSHKTKGYRQLIQTIANKYPVGLHPSYQSFTQPERVVTEKQRLEDIVSNEVTNVRAHFLRLKHPTTLEHYTNLGFTNDYTMLHAQQVGFRAGMATPYRFFNITTNTQTTLTLNPSMVMEGTLQDYMRLPLPDATELALNLITETKAVGGQFISIWHNHTFAPPYMAWNTLYKQLVK